jgi:hypothetical protein
MFYLLTIVIPTILLIFMYKIFRKGKVHKTRLIIFNILMFYLYSFLLYELAMTYPEIFGWEYYTILIFLIPITIIFIISRIYKLIKL